MQRAVLVTVALAVKAALAQTQPVVMLVDDEQPNRPDVAAPGGIVVLDEAVVQGRREADVRQALTEVISVLSSEDIARTGEGDVAGALAHVPGLSVVGGGFVYVRGLGDRYSLALLNGSPLPSPEPLRRAVPLDLFPTDVIASSLVQKTYSPNYTGEFGGGVINLTTLAIPRMPFLKVNAGVSGDTGTTNQPGYDHYGSKYDWTGYNNGLRDLPPVLAAFLASGERLSAGNVDGGAIAAQLVSWRNGVVQKVDGVPPNYSLGATGGTSWEVGGGRELGLIATAGFDNKWRTRDNLEQAPGSADLASLAKDYRQVSTENRVVANALLGLALESGENRLRWTSLYVHDTVKRTALAEGGNSQQPGRDFLEQDTGWYERELRSTQLTGSFRPVEALTLAGRLSYSQSRRDAPFELGIGYSRSNIPGDPFGAYFINRLDNGQTGDATVVFSDLGEELVSGGADLGWRAADGIVVSAGYDYAYTSRQSRRREFLVTAPSSEAWNKEGVFLLRPDHLLSPAVIERYDFQLTETTETDPAFAARLLTHGAYGQVQAQPAPDLELAAGARYERAKQVVRAEQVFNVQASSGATNRLENDYVLPAATLTWKFGAGRAQQVRVSASKTIARPQFRELIGQAFYDPESNRTFRGNPLLSDSRFLNAEARYEWYFAPEQRFSVAGFYKRIDDPIEVHTSFSDNTPISSFANAPQARLYGAELELQKHFALSGLDESQGGLLNQFMAARRVVFTGSYTYTDSRIRVRPQDMVEYYTPGQQRWSASTFFRDGSRLTGQSDHLLNLQLGLERPDRLSQATLLFSYASDRVTSRGAVGAGMPDIFESPGTKLDLVLRQGANLLGRDLELKLEARNLTGRGYREFQKRNGHTVYYNKYEVGISFGLSLSMSF